MTRVLEDFRKYEDSRIWTLQYAYYQAAVSRAFSSKAIASEAAAKPSVVKQHARVLIDLVDDLEQAGQLARDEKVRILEVGSGDGKFARQLLGTLALDCGEAGRRLLARLTYVFSDFSANMIADALSREELAAHQRSGRVLPALLDLNLPERLTTLSGDPVPGRFVAIFANYVACTLPVTVLRKTPAGITQKFLRVALRPQSSQDQRSAEQHWCDLLADAERPKLLDVVDLSGDWRPTTLAEALPDPIDQAAFNAATGRFASATVGYPQKFLAFARRMAPRMLPGAAFFVTDYGESAGTELEGLREPKIAFLGNTLNHGVNFALLEAFARAAGMSTVRTRHPMGFLPRAALVYADRVSPGLARAFRRWHGSHDATQEELTLETAACWFEKRGGFRGAALLYHRLLKIDKSPVRYYCLGRACERAGWHGLALRYLRLGRRRPGAEVSDFDFWLGRAYFGLQRLDEARRSFKRSLRRFGAQTSTYESLGMVYARQGELERARVCYRKSLRLKPHGPGAERQRALVKALDECLANSTPRPMVVNG